MSRTKTPHRAAGALIILATALTLSAGAVSLSAQEYHWEEPYWQQRADYEIHAALDPENKTLSGTVRITYLNNSPDTLDEFYLHLYPDAYREKASPLIRDYMKGTSWFLVGLPGSMRGWIDVTSLTVDGEQVEHRIDYTILESAFPRRLAPGDTARIEVVFTERIRQRVGRAGYVGNHYDIAQWYPKMVVYDRDGWHPDPFRLGEFYGEFGSFDVFITLPEEYVIAATGMPVSGDPGWEYPARQGEGSGEDAGGRETEASPETAERKPNPGMKTVHFHAENVHDFAFCADPTYVVEETMHNGYRVMSFYRSWNRSWADSVLARTVRSLRYLEERVGPYPYPQVTVADSPTHGGMEYPMLAMNGSDDEDLILHEVAHNYFYGALANDEREEAWLDEGFVQYLVFTNNERRMGGPRSPGARGMWEGLASSIVRYHRIGYAERVATPSHEFTHAYQPMVYVKSALFLRALHYTVGDEAFDRILKTYYERWKFKHVDEEVFRSVCEEVSGMDLSEIFKEWLHSTKASDYRVDRFDVEQTGDTYSVDVKIERKGEMIMPIVLAFRLRDGNTEVKHLDGMLRTIERKFTFEGEPVSVTINPDDEILDIRRIDNRSPRKRDITCDNVFDPGRPDDAYQFRFLPIGYYNEIDGGKAGLRLRGGYDDMYHTFVLQGYYGFVSEAVDFYGSYENPFGYLGRDSWIGLDAYYREGRKGGSLHIDKIFRKHLNDPWTKCLSLCLTYEELFDEQYVYPYTYDEGVNFWGGFKFSVDPKTDLFATSFSYVLDRSIWGSDFNFEKSTLEFKMWPARRYRFPLKLTVRFFLGFSSIDPSLQQMFSLAGAGVLEKERCFWLRSVGAWPKDYYNNFHVAGDANLRGYYDGNYSYRRIFSTNLELGWGFPLPVSRTTARKLDQRLYFFFDWGKVLDKKPYENLPPDYALDLGPGFFDRFFSDFGVGIKVWRFVGEFPLYLSHPELAQQSDRWDFRWTIGINSLF